MPRKPRGRARTAAVLEGRRRAGLAAARLGNAIAEARSRRDLSRRQLAEKVGLSEWRIGQIERGGGSGVPAETWFGISVALDLPLRLEFGRDALQEPTDAGHLRLQELMLRLARNLGIARFFELSTRPTHPALSVDVGWRDDRRRVLILNECWNTFGSINAAVRSTHRKLAEAEQLAAATAGGGDTADPTYPPYRVAACWIVRDTRANRALLARYPEVFEAAFPASSAAWVRALTEPAAPVPSASARTASVPGAVPTATVPIELGLVWADLHGTRLFARRIRPVMLSPH
jgi:transcriptional regulator with XRE-family HTH domain